MENNSKKYLKKIKYKKKYKIARIQRETRRQNYCNLFLYLNLCYLAKCTRKKF